jgi:hypothetical protein
VEAVRIFARLVGAVIPPRILSTDTWLADVEADHEVWDSQTHRPGASPSSGPVMPAAANPPSGGGHPTLLIDELVEDYRIYLHELFNIPQ